MLFRSFRSRLEHTLSSVQPFTFSAEYRRKLFSGLDLVMGGNKLYRLPSMNDLYWNPGGNRSLLPEHGYSEEMNLVFQNDSLNKLKTIRVTFSAAVFSRQMRNWIIWLPGASGIWTPQNLLEVWSRGTETTTQFVYHKNEIQMKVQLSTQYVLSTSQKKHSSSDQSEGNQLVYVPMYSGNATFQIKYKLLYLAYTHNYTGYRYTTSDNYYYLMPFNLANLIFGKKVIKGKMIYDFNFTSNNIFNISYQAIAGRPMPGRNYQFSINLSYKAKT